jgi:hypothetical protein
MKKLRNADSGLRIEEGNLLINPQSRIRIPQSPVWNAARIASFFLV